MGRIAQIAGGFLVHALGARQIAEISPALYFDVESIRVQAGLLRPQVPPKSALFSWKNPGGGRDLLLFLGDAQPSRNNLRFCDELLSLALEFGASRAITFAAMATPIRPDATPRVFAVATTRELLDEVREHDVEVLAEAQISGLNGVLLSAAADRGFEGVCLLGEFPFFAGAIPNPKASAAVLRVFSELAGLDLDLAPLRPQIAEIERSLVAHLGALERAARSVSQAADVDDEGSPIAAPPERKGLDPTQRARVEALFQESAQDRGKALELKAELDRLGVFEEYEDRFLDLFKQAD
jgi:hypothetical protein